MKRAIALLLVAGTCMSAQTQPRVKDGKRQVTVQAEDWRTPAEKSGYRTTPRYDETMAYVRRVAAAAPRQVRVESFGETGQGRDLLIATVSRDGVFDPDALHRARRPIVLIQNSIHAGEMDGKDSCLALLRDMVIAKSQAALLERAVVVLIPIYNADGHERFGPYNRINQNGPEQTGWRVNAENLNLNRDYIKADAPETRAWLKVWNRWLPDFFVDDHVTDGADYQYDVTLSFSGGPTADPALSDWQEKTVRPYVEQAVNSAGHVAGPLIFLKDDSDPSKGIERYPSIPRFADGYVTVQNRPGMLVEMHMLKDYKTRVTGNYEALRGLLEAVNRDADTLLELNHAADAATIAAGKSGNAKVVLRSEPTKETVPFILRGYKYRRYPSAISGQMAIEYTHEPADLTVPRPAALVSSLTVNEPRAYIVPAQWTNIIAVLEAHGLKLLRTTAPWTADVETYRCHEMKWSERSFEGHHVMFSPQFEAQGFRGVCDPVREKLSFPSGSAVVPLDQRAAKVAIQWLEPEAPDSAVAWGYFDAVFEQKEYAEDYVLEKLAREMMEKDPGLRQEFDQRVSTDKAFAADSSARLNFFFRHSTWWDPQLGLYPVGRLSTLDGVPVH